MRLKRFWKVILTILIVLALGLLLKQGLDKYNYYGQKCDSELGYTCNYYQIRQVIIKDKGKSYNDYKRILKKMEKVWED